MKIPTRRPPYAWLDAAALRTVLLQGTSAKHILAIEDVTTFHILLNFKRLVNN